VWINKKDKGRNVSKEREGRRINGEKIWLTSSKSEQMALSILVSCEIIKLLVLEK
jgi:alkylation response protein AidB-like acyl-CoA dehydrogenase